MVKTIPEDKARQGRRGSPVLIVLVSALVLALAVWGGVELYGKMIAADTPAEQGTVPNG